MSIFDQLEQNHKRGWRQFPCLPDKRPATVKGVFENGAHSATMDLELLRDHFVQNPSHCIGVATGAQADGAWLVVIDHDSYKDDADDLPPLPATYSVQTGQGGWQHYLSSPEPVPNSAGRLGVGIDVRGTGGYVVGAGSTTVFGDYAALQWDAPVAEIPSELLARLRPAQAVAATSSAGTFDASLVDASELDRLARYAAAAFDKECTRLRAAAEGSRNQTTFEVACSLLEVAQSPWNDLVEADAHAALMASAPVGPGFDQLEVIQCWNSARKTVEGKARPMPVAPEGHTLKIADADDFYDRGRLLVQDLAAAVLQQGPLAVDATADRHVWAYRPHGVWQEAPHEVGDRVNSLLGNRARKAAAADVQWALQSQLARRGPVIECLPVPEYVNCRNGMLRWRTGELVRHDPADRSTVQLPVEYDAGARCPMFDKFLSEVMAADAIDYIWEVLGYLVLNGNPLQRAFLLHGEGANGKGTLIHVVKQLLGGAGNVSSVSLDEMSTDKFKVAELYGKVANMAGDIDPTYMRSTARFKSITGEDVITVDRKYGQPFQFECWAVSVFSANKFWRSADTTQGYRRRWLLVPFPHTFADPDPTLKAKLTTELPGVLAGAVAGLRRLMGRGRFDPPLSAMDAKDAFELAGDQVREWLREDPCIVSADPGSPAWCTAAEAYRAYKSWCEDTGNQAVRSSEFRSRLLDTGFTIRKVGTMRVIGLSIDRSLGHRLSVTGGDESAEDE